MENNIILHLKLIIVYVAACLTLKFLYKYDDIVILLSHSELECLLEP